MGSNPACSSRLRPFSNCDPPVQNLAENQDHVVQFYENDAFLTRVVAPFIGASLRRDAAALMVCTFEHLSAFAQAMEGSALDIKQMQRRGTLVWIDARMALAKLRADGVAAFFGEIGARVARLCTRSGNYPLHVYGELVDLLWSEGRPDEAVELENMWNRLLQEHRFNLMCSYRITNAAAERAQLRAVCGTHTHVLRPEKFMGVRVLDDARGPHPRHGEREMIRDLKARDQRVADGLREDLAQTLFGLVLQAQGIKGHVSPETRDEVDGLIESLARALQLSLAFADEIVPYELQASSLVDALQKYAALTERLFGVACTVKVGRGFCDPDRIQRELLYALVREVVDRAVRERSAKEIVLKVSRRGRYQKLSISHDGEDLVPMGARDDGLRRLIYQVRALGGILEVHPKKSDTLQFVCRW